MPKGELVATEIVIQSPTQGNNPQPEFTNPTVESADNKNNITDTPNKTITCPDAPKTRMEIGMKARVTYRNNTALALRNKPSLSKSSFIKDLREGTKFTVIGGPECLSGFSWWKIETKEGAVGWSAEGNEKEYYMQPYKW